MYQKFIKTGSTAQRCSTMETRDHSKNGANPKSLMSRGNLFINMRKLFILIFVISIYFVGNCQKTTTTFNSKGEKEVITTSKTGNVTGTYFRYYKSGVLAEKSQWLEGERNGLTELYEDKTEAVLLRANYKLGKLDGKYEKWWRQWDAPYKLVKMISCAYKNDEKDGSYKEWHTSTEKLKIDENYKMGKLDGVSKSYYEDGKLLWERSYIDGSQHGTDKTYYNTGKIRDEAFYQNGYKQGISKEFYEDGKIKRELNYEKSNFLVGKYYEYENEQKVLIRTNTSGVTIDSTFKNGELVSVKKETEKNFDKHTTTTWYNNGEIEKEYRQISKNKENNSITTTWYKNGKIEKVWNLRDMKYSSDDFNREKSIEYSYIEDTVFYNLTPIDSIVYMYGKSYGSWGGFVHLFENYDELLDYEKEEYNGERYDLSKSLLRKEEYRMLDGEMKLISYWDKKEEEEKIKQQQAEEKRRKEEERRIKEEEERKILAEEKRIKEEEEKRIREEKLLKAEEERKIKEETDMLANFTKLANDTKDMDLRRIATKNFQNLDAKQQNDYNTVIYRYNIKKGAVGDEYKEKPYYAKLINILVNTNKLLNSEWTKNGSYFKDEVEFYDAYHSPDYNDIVKQNKKKAKK